MIQILTKSDIPGLNTLPPIDWEFDFEQFLYDYIDEDYFHAFVMIQDGQIVGTGNAFMKNKVAWLANIIIDANYRRKGLGFKMTKHLVDYLISIGCETQILIASSLGKPVYNKVGFRKVSEYHCFDSDTNISFPISKPIRLLIAEDLAEVNKLDQEINSENRAHLIGKYYSNGLGYFNSENKLQGFYLPDFSRGLVLAKDKTAGIELLKLKHSKTGMRTMLPAENKEGIEFLERAGLKKGEKHVRMLLGKNNNWNPQYIYSYASGYCG
ncbi:MAG: GNAT superfamily N-acetyltransferase [Saprospiraceae bacterium]|jgi:GNAT superfamily N-acetyltransferase